MSATLWMSGEIDADVYDAYREAEREVEAAVNDELRHHDYGEGIRELAFIAILRAEDSPIYCEVAKYHKKDGSFEFRLKIPHAEFKRAGRQEMRKLIVAAVRRAVREMPKLTKRNVQWERLDRDVSSLAARRGWL